LELTAGVTAAVLLAALLHAGWNAMIRASSDKLLDTGLVCLGGSLVVLPLIPLVDPPAPAAWPYLAGSMAVHVGYFTALVGAYRAGELSHAYPIMRGVAPVLVALAALAGLGDPLKPTGWLGIALVCGGVLSLGFAGLDRRHAAPATRWALANAAIIACYTLIDGQGVRVSGSAAGYVLWMFLVDCLPFGLIVLAMRRGELVRYAAARWGRGLAGGASSAASYGIAVWAMTLAPVAAVAALRESSVIFAALIGTFVLKEGHARARLAGAAVVLAGIVALKL